MKNKLFWILMAMSFMTANSCKKADDDITPQPYLFGNGGTARITWTPSTNYTPMTDDTVAGYSFGKTLKQLFKSNDTVILVVDTSLAMRDYMLNHFVCSLWHQSTDSLEAVKQSIGGKVLLGSGTLYTPRIDSIYPPHPTHPTHGDGPHMHVTDREKFENMRFKVVLYNDQIPKHGDSPQQMVLKRVANGYSK